MKVCKICDKEFKHDEIIFTFIITIIGKGTERKEEINTHEECSDRLVKDGLIKAVRHYNLCFM